MKHITTLVIAAFVTSFTATQSFAATNAQPEITIQNQAPKDTKARIVAANAAHGYKLVSASSQVLVFSKPYPSPVKNAPGVKPQLITRYTITNAGAVVGISATIGTKMVHAGHGESAVIDLTEGIGAPELKAILRQIKTNAASSPKGRNA